MMRSIIEYDLNDWSVLAELGEQIPFLIRIDVYDAPLGNTNLSGCSFLVELEVLRSIRNVATRCYQGVAKPYGVGVLLCRAQEVEGVFDIVTESPACNAKVQKVIDDFNIIGST